MLKRYPKAAKAVVDILRELAQAEAVIAEANADLPLDAQPIVTAEQFTRGLPADKREHLAA